MNIILAGNFKWSNDDLQTISNGGQHQIIICKSEEETLTVPCSEIDVVIGNWFFKYHNLSAFTKLRFIQLLSTGYNGLDADEAQNRGIAVYNARDVYSIPISEFVIGRILAFYKKESFFVNNQREHQWIKNRTLEEVYGKKVLIVGTGSIGIEIAKRIRSFTGNVYGCNRTVHANNCFDAVFPLAQLNSIIGEYDIVILTIALAKETKGLINKDSLSAMKPSAIIVNISRGEVINEQDLISAICLGRIGGAILDVFESEPLSQESPLWDMKKVFISPHNSFVSDKVTKRLRDVVLNNYKAWVSENEQ